MLSIVTSSMMWFRDRFGHCWWYWPIVLPTAIVVIFIVGSFVATFAMFVTGKAMVQLIHLLQEYWEIARPPFLR